MGKTVNAGSDQGFSMAEMMMVIAIIGIVSAMALVAFMNEMPVIRADSAMQLMESNLRAAREIAVDQRRNIQVTFQGVGEMVTVRQNQGGGTTQLGDFILDPNYMTYVVLASVPDTPDAFGKAAAVNFNCGSTLPTACTITFQSDGSVIDHTGATGAYINGTIFMGTIGNAANKTDPRTARAITILGTTGRIKGYRYNGTAWY